MRSHWSFHDDSHLRIIPSSDICNLDRGATNASSSAPIRNAAAHITTRSSRCKHHANSTCTTTDADHDASSESSDTELDRNPANHNDWASDPDHHQSGRARHRTCSSTKRTDASTDADCTESDRSATRTAAEPDRSERHRAVCHRANPNAEPSQCEHRVDHQ